MTQTRKSALWILVGVIVGLLALSLLGGPALAQETPPETDFPIFKPNMDSDHYGLNWDVTGSGGGMISSTHFTVNSTIGQPAVGTTASTHYQVCSGYWCWLDRLASIFLPLITRN